MEWVAVFVPVSIYLVEGGGRVGSNRRVNIWVLGYGGALLHLTEPTPTSLYSQPQVQGNWPTHHTKTATGTGADWFTHLTDIGGWSTNFLESQPQVYRQTDPHPHPTAILRNRYKAEPRKLATETGNSDPQTASHPKLLQKQWSWPIHQSNAG